MERDIMYMSRSEAASEFKRREDAARRSRRLAKRLCMAAYGQDLEGS